MWHRAMPCVKHDLLRGILQRAKSAFYKHNSKRSYHRACRALEGAKFAAVVEEHDAMLEYEGTRAIDVVGDHGKRCARRSQKTCVQEKRADDECQKPADEVAEDKDVADSLATRRREVQAFSATLPCLLPRPKCQQLTCMPLPQALHAFDDGPRCNSRADRKFMRKKVYARTSISTRTH